MFKITELLSMDIYDETTGELIASWDFDQTNHPECESTNETVTLDEADVITE